MQGSMKVTAMAASGKAWVRARQVAGLAGFSALLIGAAMGMARSEEIIQSHGISAFGELKYPADFKHFDLVNPDAPKGGRMTFRGTGASSTFDSLNAFILKGEPAQGLGLLYDSLLSGSTDESDAGYGLIAESLEYPEDRSWVIFTMRPEARFSDGEPITAEDVVFTFNVLLEKGSPSYQVVLRDIEKVEALEEHKVKFSFREGAAMRDLPSLAGGLSILPRHYYDSVDFAESTMVPPVGSGQYLVKEAQPGRSIEYCRNPDYWGKDLPVNIGTANFDCYIYEYYQDTTAAFEAFKSGGYLFHQEFSSSIWANGYDFPALSRGWVVKAELPDNRPAGTQGFWFNLRKSKFQDPKVREALGLMFNFEWSNETLFYGLYSRTDSFFENSPLQAEGLPEGEELAVLEEFRDQLPPEIFTEPPYTPEISGTRQLDRKALRRAAGLMEEAGWIVGDDGLRRNAQGEVFTVEFIEDQPSFLRVMEPYVSNLRDLGVDARITRIDAAQMQQRQENFNYDIITGRFVMSLTPSVELRQLFSSAAAELPGSANFTGIADPVIDVLIEKVIGAKTREEVQARSRALDRVLRSKQIWVPQWYSAKYLVAYWDVFGKPDQQPPYSRGDGLWWWDADKFDRLRSEGALR
ncbi:MAG: extracellular solute-binding protein [Pseudorhodobacter sp.]